MLVFLKDGGFVAHRGEVIGATQSGRTAADDGYLLVPAFLDIGAYVHLRHETVFGVQVLLRNEFLDRINRNGLVYRAACAGVLASAVADTSAHCRERVLAFDELQRLAVFALGGFFQIALDGDVCRTGGLAGRRAGRVAVDAVAVAVVFVPLVRTPLGRVRQLLFRVFDSAVRRA